MFKHRARPWCSRHKAAFSSAERRLNRRKVSWASDSGSGEQRDSRRLNPQRLDTLVGKILRIVPDLREHMNTSSVSENGRYRIPSDNPFTTLDGARKEIW